MSIFLKSCIVLMMYMYVGKYMGIYLSPSNTENKIPINKQIFNNN